VVFSQSVMSLIVKFVQRVFGCFKNQTVFSFPSQHNTTQHNTTVLFSILLFFFTMMGEKEKLEFCYYLLVTSTFTVVSYYCELRGPMI
jgi:hypothetical protein